MPPTTLASLSNDSAYGDDVTSAVPWPMANTPECQNYRFIIDTVIIGSLCLLGLAGNTLSICVFRKHKTETSTVFLFQVLSVTDSILLLTSFLMYSLYIRQLPFYTKHFQYVQTYLWPVALMAHTATVWITVVISVHRYTLICKPVGLLRAFMSKISRAQVTAVLSFSVIYNIPRFFEHQSLPCDHPHDNYTHSANSSSTHLHRLGSNKIYQIVYSNLLYWPIMYIVPLCLLAYFNSKLIKGVQALQERKETLTGHSNRSREDSCNVNTIVIVIVCIFILCQTPALINQIFWASLDTRACGTFHFYYTHISDLLVVLNSSINFVIYCLFGRTFRQLFIDSLCCSRACC